ncbi:MAG TPA: HD domain-containing phosphohydrolase [Candidatus Limnocylindrales bacterium]|nr:HD domain-containing phosphohydrolase [Candidatus Limnocylindrales bacterium]
MPNGRFRPRVLVVEDDVANRALLTHLLTRAGYEALAVSDGRDGLRAALEDHPSLVLLDVELPGMNGFDVCRALRADPRTVALPIILLTGRSSGGDVVAGLDAGADDFLRKPYDQAELMARVRSVLRLADAMAEIDGAHGVIAALANAVEAKDAITEQHCQRLASLAHRLGTAVELEPAALRALTFGAMLHDIGKIGVRDEILTKPGPLTREEWADMRMHPLIGERICEPLALSRAFGPIIRNHHEHWDGGGYPDGLRGDRIPVGARIVGVVDAYDAMVHARPYRPARDPEVALAELRRGAGRQFDPGLVPVFVQLILAGADEGDEGPIRSLEAMSLAI